MKVCLDILACDCPRTSKCSFKASGGIHMRGSTCDMEAIRSLWTWINFSHSSSDKRSSKRYALIRKHKEHILNRAISNIIKEPDYACGNMCNSKV